MTPTPHTREFWRNRDGAIVVVAEAREHGSLGQALFCYIVKPAAVGPDKGFGYYVDLNGRYINPHKEAPLDLVEKFL